MIFSKVFFMIAQFYLPNSCITSLLRLDEKIIEEKMQSIDDREERYFTNKLNTAHNIQIKGVYINSKYTGITLWLLSELTTN